MSLTRSALYYPFPFIRQEEWLRAAALFWDRIFRIVPEGFQEMHERGRKITAPSDSEKILRDELNFVGDLNPDHLETEYATATLIELMDEKPEILAEEGGYFTWGDLELSKVQTRHQDSLASRGALIPDRNTMFGWKFRVGPGRVYMALLAKFMGEKEMLPVVTDNKAHDRILVSEVMTSQTVRYSDGFFDDHVLWATPNRLGARSNEEFVLCRMLFDGIGLQHLEGATPRKIVSVRKKYDSERRAFLHEVQEAIRHLQDVPSSLEAHRREVLRDHAHRILAARDEYGAAMRGIGIEAIFGVVIATFVLPIANVIANSFPMEKSVMLGVAGAASAVRIGSTLYSTHLKRSEKRRAEPVPFYLHQLSKKLT